MNILIKILPVILISIIFYLLVYNLYPKYQETITLVKKLNELQNKEKEIKALEKSIQDLNQNINLKQLINQRDVLNIWLPEQPKIEDIIYSLNFIYQTLGFNFNGTDFVISKEPKSFNSNFLPLGVINFKLSIKISSDKINTFLDLLEKNTRLMKIKRIFLSPTETSEVEVETYYLPKSFTNEK